MNTYIFPISIYRLCFLTSIVSELTILLLLWFKREVHHNANYFLIAALFVMVLWMAKLFAADIGEGFSLRFSLAFGPLIYFYVLKLTKQDCF